MAQASAWQAPAVLGRGFRPFFLLGGLFAVVAVPLWLAALTGRWAPGGALQGALWHGHELIFGFTAAILAGFLLTAAMNWTGRVTAVGLPLGGLAVLWVVGRVLASTAAHPALLVVEWLFLPAVALAVGRAVVGADNRRNYFLVGLLAALAACDGAVHLDLAGRWPGAGPVALRVAVQGVAVIILAIAGRIVPMFTRNATAAQDIRSIPALDRTALGGAVAVAVLSAADPGGVLLRVAAGVTGLAVLGRAWGWGGRATLSNPLLWVLHLGHALMGLSWLALAGGAPPSLALHGLTVGGIGVMCLGMMARVSLGHTGRPLQVGRPLALAFGAMGVAALVRVLGPWGWPAASQSWWTLAAVLWTAAFGAWALGIGPLLLRPRPDGKPG